MASEVKAAGSFIQGWLAASYSDEQWHELFGYMDAAGIKTLIVQTTLDESDGSSPPAYSPTQMQSLYPSAIPGVTYRGNTPGTDVSPVESILMHAQENGIKVFLGLNLYSNAWFYDFNRRPFVTDTGWGALEAARGNAVADELAALYLAKYPDAFHGWYWAWEVDNSAVFQQAPTQAALAAMMNANFDHLATIELGLPVMTSPFFNTTLGSPADYASMWSNVFARLNDFGENGIFAPQDGVGAQHATVDVLGDWYLSLARAVAGKPGLTQWANCETYEIDGDKNATASLARVIQQFASVAPYVENIVTFAYCHYDSPLVTDPSIQDAWVLYSQTGTLSTGNS